MNLGSTSFKFKLFGDGLSTLATGGVENIGRPESAYKLAIGESKSVGVWQCPTHDDAFAACLAALTDSGALESVEALDAVGYKAVHGGRLSGAMRVDDALMDEMERMCSFAPAHNPVYLRAMRGMAKRYPALRQVACFETAFHATMPLERAIYGVPYEWLERYGVRRYGFHGSSHSYIAMKMGELEPDAKRLISVHLGGSSSLCAILDGKSVASSMGATPQSGLFHNDRVGDLDVFCLPELVEKEGGLDAVMKKLGSASGFLGVSGVSNDMRDVERAAAEGNERAALAVRAFADNIAGYIGMFTAYLGGLDAIAFTGGIGQNDSALRESVCKRFGYLGLQLDAKKNDALREGLLSAEGSRLRVYALETNEELMVAKGVIACLGL